MAFVTLCEADPDAARQMLAADQAALAEEIEQAFEAYDLRLRDLATRVHDMEPDDVAREAAAIRDAQDALRRALRRIDVSFKTAGELTRELGRWEERSDDGPVHADHPSVRAEILRSELRTRGIQPPVSASTPEPVVIRSRDISDPAMLLTGDEVVRQNASRERVFDHPDIEPIPDVDIEHLLSAIREATREAERWHAMPAEAVDEDALVQVRHLRDLHTELKRRDREAKVVRDRVAYAVSMQELR